MNKIKSALIIMVLSFLLVSCNKDDDEKASTNEYANYQMSKEKFEKEFNRDYVLTKSNYRIEEIYSDRDTVYANMDYGKCKIETGSSSFFYNIKLEGEVFKLTSYRAEDSYNRTLTKQEMYDFFFSDLDYLFDIKYEHFAFNKETKAYDGDVSHFDSKYGVSKFIMKIKDKEINTIEAVINDEFYQMNFKDLGRTTVTLPTIPTSSPTLTYSYSLTYGKTDAYVVEYINNCLSGLKIDNAEVSANSGTLVVQLHDITDERIGMYLQRLLMKPVNGVVAISNAHNTVVTSLTASVQMFSEYLTLNIYSPSATLESLVNTTLDDALNDNRDFGFRYSYQEDEDKTYHYPFFIWDGYDEDVCTFDNYKDSNVNTLEKLILSHNYSSHYSTKEDLIDDLGDKYRLKLNYTYIDYDGDGYLSTKERQRFNNMYSGVATLLNIRNEGIILNLQ